MLVDRFRCPECSVVLKPFVPQPEGKRIKCPRCATTFAVKPEGGQAGAAAPAPGFGTLAPAPDVRVKPEREGASGGGGGGEGAGPQHGSQPPFAEADVDEDSDEVDLRSRPDDRSKHLALLGAGIGVCVVLLVLAVGVLIYAFADQPRLENLGQVKAGMSQKEVEALIGPGQVVSRISLPGRPEIKVVEWKGSSQGAAAEVTLSFEDDRCIAGFAPESPATGAPSVKEP